MQSLFYDTWTLLDKRTPEENLEDILLRQRGIDSDKKKQEFFETQYPDGIHDPQEFLDYDKAIERISDAIKNEERIVIFGDYDVDGTVGTSILVEILQRVGAKVSYRIPHRKDDGYGLKSYFVDELKENNVSLLVTVDNGISAVEEVKHANNLGIDVIITDHHLPHDEVPPAFAIVNHKQTECEYPYPELCGAALGYKIALGIAKHFLSEDEYQAYARGKLDLVALATVADCMPLLGENRVLVKAGLEVLKNTKNPGLQAMKQTGNINYDFATSETFGFQIGPRINAGGRLAHAYYGLQLLLGKTEFAETLEKLNEQRKDMVSEALEGVMNQDLHPSIIIESSPEWHTGIIGLIAGKLTEKNHCPSIILEEQEEQAVASCRAPEGFDMFAFLSEFKDDFLHFGGHAQAAGFSIKKENLAAFKKKAEKRATEILMEQPLNKTLQLSAELFAHEISLNTYKQIEHFEPFGIGNEKPVFVINNLENIQWKFVGKENEHLTGNFKSPSGEWIKIIRFFATDIPYKLLQSKSVNIACKLGKNVWREQESLQLELVDIQTA